MSVDSRCNIVVAAATIATIIVSVWQLSTYSRKLPSDLGMRVYSLIIA